MASIIPRTTNGLAPTQVPSGFSYREGKDLARRQNAEAAHGLVAGTRVRAAGFVAATGIQMVGMLSREAAFQAGDDPAAAARVNFIVDRYAEVVGNEVARFGM